MTTSTVSVYNGSSVKIGDPSTGDPSTGSNQKVNVPWLSFKIIDNSKINSSLTISPTCSITSSSWASLNSIQFFNGANVFPFVIATNKSLGAKQLVFCGEFTFSGYNGSTNTVSDNGYTGATPNVTYVSPDGTLSWTAAASDSSNSFQTIGSCLPFAPTNSTTNTKLPILMFPSAIPYGWKAVATNPVQSAMSHIIHSMLHPKTPLSSAAVAGIVIAVLVVVLTAIILGVMLPKRGRSVSAGGRRRFVSRW